MSGRRVLVTGGAGFIGSAVIPELRRRGDEVLALDDLSFGRWENVDLPEERRITATILDREALERTILDFDPEWILHLAAIHFIPHCNAHPVETSRVNLLGTMHVLDAATKLQGLRGFLFASTAAVYPIHDGAVAEEHPTEPLDVYGITKLAGERLCRDFQAQSGVPTVACRFFNAFGPNETNPHLIPEIHRQLEEGKRTIALGNVDPKRDFIHTHDMARAIRGLTEHFEQGFDVFNLGSGREYSVREIVAAFERQLGEAITIEQDPARVRKVERMHLLADVAKLRSFLDWEPRIGLDEGIRDLVTSTRSPS